MGQSAAMRIPAPDDLPWRGHGAARPPAAAGPVPAGRMPLVRDRRPLKHWRYAGVFGEEVMLCAGCVRVAGVPQAFWAVWDRRRGVLRERTRLGSGRRAVALPGDAVRVRGRGAVVLDGREIAVRAPALLDGSPGWHARETAWDGCAGAGSTADGRAVVWNLVAGVHDAPRASERTVWVDGVARETLPVAFPAALDAVGDLRFAAEAERRRRDRLAFGLLESEYRQPFGVFSGSLPGGIALVDGRGVMERHRARW
jgi:uncharacterized protein DUF2804